VGVACFGDGGGAVCGAGAVGIGLEEELLFVEFVGDVVSEGAVGDCICN